MSLGEPKSPLQSLTVNAGIGALVVSFLNVLGIQLGPDAGLNIDAIITGIFAAIAIYGRVRATRRVAIGDGTPPPPVVGLLAIGTAAALLMLTACSAGPSAAPGSFGQAPAANSSHPLNNGAKKVLLAAETAYVTTAATIDALADVPSIPAETKLKAADMLEDSYGYLVLARASFAAGNALLVKQRADAVLTETARIEQLLMPNGGPAK